MSLLTSPYSPPPSLPLSFPHPPSCRHLCAKERNLLLTEMAWRRVPKDKDEQMLWSMPRGSPKEEDVHRLRYGEVGGRERT